jgi:hypothetical protein
MPEGAIAFEQMSARQRMGWLKPALAALIMVGVLALLPLFSPLYREGISALAGLAAIQHSARRKELA